MATKESEIQYFSQEKKSRRQNPHEGPYLTNRPKEVLHLTARGLSVKQIGAELSISEYSVRHHKREIFAFSDAASSINAVFLALDQGYLNYEDLTRDLDENALGKLTERELEVLDASTANNGRNNSNKEIAESLFINQNTVRTHFRNIMRKTNLNRMQVAVLYSEAKKNNSLRSGVSEPSNSIEKLPPRKKEILTLTAQGYSRQEIANKLVISKNTVIAHLDKLYLYFDINDETGLAIKGISMGIADPSEFIERLELDKSLIFKLTPQEKIVLETMTSYNGKNTSNKEIGSLLSISENAIKGHLRNISLKLGRRRRTEIALFYLATTKDMKEKEEQHINHEERELSEASAPFREIAIYQRSEKTN